MPHISSPVGARQARWRDWIGDLAGIHRQARCGATATRSHQGPANVLGRSYAPDPGPARHIPLHPLTRLGPNANGPRAAHVPDSAPRQPADTRSNDPLRLRNKCVAVLGFRFRFISAHHAVYGVMCRVLNVSRSGFYRWRRAASARAARADQDARPAERIRAVDADSGGTYGSQRVHTELWKTGEQVTGSTGRLLGAGVCETVGVGAGLIGVLGRTATTRADGVSVRGWGVCGT
jgi:hypothetical protein